MRHVHAHGPCESGRACWNFLSNFLMILRNAVVFRALCLWKRRTCFTRAATTASTTAPFCSDILAGSGPGVP